MIPIERPHGDCTDIRLEVTCEGWIFLWLVTR